MPSKLTTIAAIAALGALTVPAVAADFSFGWEDGTSTILSPSFGVTDADADNVSAGTVVDYGPSASPFDPPAVTEITAFDGTRFLEVTDPDAGGSDPGIYLGFIDNLNVGDTITYSFRFYDPSDGRSPSIRANGIYAENNDFTDFGGFPGSNPDFVDGTGWLLTEYTVTFGDGAYDATDTGIVLQASTSTPTLAETSSGGPGTYDFYLDDLQITVNSTSPTATLLLPDGSVTLINAIPEPTAIAGLLAGGGMLLLRRHKA